LNVAPRTRVAVLISGRGSNMRALIEAAQAADYPGEIALVVSSRSDAPGLSAARDAGVPTVVVDQVRFRRENRDREAYDAELHDELTKANIGFVASPGSCAFCRPALCASGRGGSPISTLPFCRRFAG
jgi:phosphoribosylglycinamide formyltransferase-1